MNLHILAATSLMSLLSTIVLLWNLFAFLLSVLIIGTISIVVVLVGFFYIYGSLRTLLLKNF